MKKTKRGGVGEMWRSSALYDTARKARGKERLLAYTIALDAVFLLILAGLNKAMMKVFPNPQNVVVNAGTTVLTMLLGLLVFLLLVLLAYSFVKLLVMQKVHAVFAKGAAGPRMFRKFFLSNLLLFAMYGLAILVVSLVLVISIRIQLIDTVRNIFLGIIAFLLYLSVNTMHSLFMQGMQKPWKLYRRTMDLVFNRLRIYLGLVGFSIVAFFLLAGVYYAFDWIVLLVLGEALQNSTVYTGYAIVNTLVIFLLAFGLVAFNRAYFYNIVQREGGRGAKDL